MRVALYRTFLLALVVAAVLLSGCAAKTVRGRAEVSALSVGQVVLLADQTLTDAYETGLIPDAQYAPLDRTMSRLLEVAEIYVRAVEAWREIEVQAAQRTLFVILDEIERAAAALSERPRTALIGTVQAARIILTAGVRP